MLPPILPRVPERDDGSVEYGDDDDDADDDSGVDVMIPTPENIVEGMAERTALLNGF
jgi:hypothetical protein